MSNRNTNKNIGDYYPGYRHPKSLIAYVVWQYHRFMLSPRDVSELLVRRGIQVSYETIREWGLKGEHHACETNGIWMKCAWS
jgi:transposase-like protein